jgi:hypothetical protein
MGALGAGFFVLHLNHAANTRRDKRLCPSQNRHCCCCRFVSAHSAFAHSAFLHRCLLLYQDQGLNRAAAGAGHDANCGIAIALPLSKQGNVCHPTPAHVMHRVMPFSAVFGSSQC